MLGFLSLSIPFPRSPKTPTLQYFSSIERSIEGKKMKNGKKLLLLKTFLLMFNLFFTTSVAEDSPTSFCGKIRIQAPFLSSNSTDSSLLYRMVQCKSQKLYFRTSLGLFPISSINYTGKFLILSHRPCSSTVHYVSPLLLSAGFLPSPLPNSLMLFNCPKKGHPLSSSMRSCPRFYKCGAFSSQVQEQEQPKGHHSCLLIDDLEKLNVRFDPKDFNCSHYSHIHRSLVDDNYEGYKLGTRISFDIPGHPPNPCDECQKPNGNCGVGLRCICHPRECKNKVISMGGSVEPFANVLSLLPLFLVVVSITNM